jgi:hypothetical protein
MDFEGFLSPVVVRRYGEYMHAHRFGHPDGIRAADNWQKGIPQDAYMKSAWRHFMDWWLIHRDHVAEDADGRGGRSGRLVCVAVQRPRISP